MYCDNLHYENVHERLLQKFGLQKKAQEELAQAADEQGAQTGMGSFLAKNDEYLNLLDRLESRPYFKKETSRETHEARAKEIEQVEHLPEVHLRSEQTEAY